MIQKEKLLFHEQTEPTVSIYGIRAEKVILCGPPAMWHIEAAVALRSPGKPEETVYISIGEWEPEMVQITRNSVFSPDGDIDVIDSCESAQDVSKSCYRDAIQTVRKIFESICASV